MIRLNSKVKVQRIKPIFGGQGLHLHAEAEPPEGDPQVRIVLMSGRGAIELPPGRLLEGELSQIKPGQVYEVLLKPVADHAIDCSGQAPAPGERP